MNTLFSQTRRTTTLSAVTAAFAAVSVLVGCGGGAGNTSAARIRAVDAATGAATVNILVNSSSTYGDQTYFSVSPYQYIATGTSVFSYTTTASTTAITSKNNSLSLNSDQFYTAYLIGRPDVAASDTRFLQDVISDDSKPAIPSGQVAVRILHAAPDAGPVDVLVNGSVPNTTFTDVTYEVTGNNFLPNAYQLLTAGTLSVQVNTTGTSHVIIPAASLNLTAGKAYTLLVTEPTGGTAPLGVAGGTAPTFALQTTNE